MLAELHYFIEDISGQFKLLYEQLLLTLAQERKFYNFHDILFGVFFIPYKWWEVFDIFHHLIYPTYELPNLGLPEL